jgi:hypothetical protein
MTRHLQQSMMMASCIMFLAAVTLFSPVAAAQPLDDGYGGLSAEVNAGLSGRPRRVAAPAVRASDGTNGTAAPAAVVYAYDFTFQHPHNGDITHFTYSAALPLTDVWADDEPSLLSVDCSWPPERAASRPAPDAVYVELTYASASANRLTRGSMFFGAETWGCAVAPAALPGAFLLEAVNAPTLIDADADSATFGAWMVNGSVDRMMSMLSYDFFAGPPQQHAAVQRSGMLPDVLGAGNATARRRTTGGPARKLHLSTDWSAPSANYALNVGAVVGNRFGPFLVSSASAIVNAGGTSLSVSTSRGVRAQINVQLSMQASIAVSHTNDVDSGSSTPISGFCIPGVCGMVSFFGIFSASVGMMFDLLVPWSITNTVESSFSLYPQLTLTAHYDTGNNAYSLSKQFKTTTSALPTVSGAIYAEFGLQPRVYAGAIASANVLVASGSANIKAGVSYTWYITASLSLRLPQFVNGTLPSTLANSVGCAADHAVRLSIGWRSGDANIFATGGASGSVFFVTSRTPELNYNRGDASLDVAPSQLWGMCMPVAGVALAWSALFPGDTNWMLSGCPASAPGVCGLYSNVMALGLSDGTTTCSGRPVYASVSTTPQTYVWRVAAGGWAVGGVSSLCSAPGSATAALSTTDDTAHPASVLTWTTSTGERADNVTTSALSSFMLLGCPSHASALCGQYTASPSSVCAGQPVYALNGALAESAGGASLFLDPQGSSDWLLSDTRTCSANALIKAFLSVPAGAANAGPKDPVTRQLITGATWNFWNGSGVVAARVPPPPPSPPSPPSPPPPPSPPLPPPAPPPMHSCNPHDCNPYQSPYRCGGGSCTSSYQCPGSTTCQCGVFGCTFGAATCTTSTCSQTLYNTCYDMCLDISPPPPSPTPPPSPLPPSPLPPM